MENAEHYDALVIGCGFAGAVVAHEMAKNGRKVLILERRNHIAGNMYDADDDSGVLVHWYGPHIFHTDDTKVFDFLRPFSDWFAYEHRVLARIKGRLVPLPFSFKSLEMLYEKRKAAIIKSRLLKRFKDRRKVSVLDLITCEDDEIRSFGDFVYEHVFAHYSAKQWGVPVKEVDRSVIDRVPVVLGYDDRYFHDTIQLMPRGGFTELFGRILGIPRISVELGQDATKIIKMDPAGGRILVNGKPWCKPVVYTGPIDELFRYRFGTLSYRSLDLSFERYAVDEFQTAAVVNYPNEERFTRITEFKHLTGQHARNRTTILKEYPRVYDPNSSEGNIPYYPVINDDNRRKHAKYKDMAARCDNVYLCGRLADYTYYNMDAIVAKALQVAKEVKFAA
jgi:UDP-galactopyranose mutase